MTADPTELDELESGVTSGFWQRVCTHVAQEYGPGGAAQQLMIQKAIAGPLGSEAEAVQRLKVAMAVQVAMAGLLRWPTERIAHIQAGVDRQAPSGSSRRGPGL